MPIFDYRCTECGSTYDIYHKVREIVDDVVCPHCGSKGHVRLMSAPMVSVAGRSSPDFSAAPSCAPGTCCGGACDIN